MIKRIKSWRVDRFLPMWAKQTVLADNKHLQQRVAELEAELEEKTAYINGLMVGIKSQRRIVINNTREEKK